MIVNTKGAFTVSPPDLRSFSRAKASVSLRSSRADMDSAYSFNVCAILNCES